MLVQRISQLQNYKPIIFTINARHKRPVCPGSRGRRPGGPCAGASKAGGADGKILRHERSGKCRFGFVPEEWFLFFSNKTGVSGPYFLLLGLANYACSKEILVMEHEYYSGLSIALVLYLISTKLGPQIGASLDKEVDEIAHSYQKGRDDEKALHEDVIKQCELGMERAKGQELLMAAKKENIQLQLEAAYRERMMMVYNGVKGRIMYQIRKNNVETRIHQRWMIEWILKNVRQSITPDFQKQALRSAISELSSISIKG